MGYAWAFSLSRANQVKQAKAVLDKVSAAPLQAEMLILIGKVYNDVGDHANALRCFQGAIRQDPTMKQAHGGAGVSLIRLNRPAEAVPELEAELKLNPADPDAQYQLGYALLQLSKEDQAIPILRTLIAAHPDHARARYQLGKTLLDMGQVEEAIQNLQAAADMDPGSRLHSLSAAKGVPQNREHRGGGPGTETLSRVENTGPRAHSDRWREQHAIREHFRLMSAI